MREARSATVAVMVLWLLAATDESAALRDGAARHEDSGPLGRLAGSLRDRMLDVVGPDEIVERLDVNAVLERVDLDALLERVDVDALLERVDVNRLLERVDVDAVFARVDPDALLARVDVEALLARVDMNQLLARVDIDAVIDQVDVERVVRRAGIPEIVAESTGSVFESTLDLLRRQLLGLDVVETRAVMRLLSRDEYSLPAGPDALVGDGGPTHSMPVPNAPTTDVTGHYAGGVTRLAAFIVDIILAMGSFTITSGALGSTLRTAGLPIDDLTGGGVLFAASSALWLFTYWWATTAIAGRTPGMALVGLRIVTRTGLPVSGRRAFVRVLALPLSFLLLGLGLLGIIVDRERRALHDLIAGTSVAYDWGDRMATMPTPLARWLAQREAAIDPPDTMPRPTSRDQR